MLREAPEMKYVFIEKHQAEFSIKAMCRVLRVARSGWYTWCQRRTRISPRQQFRQHCDSVVLATYPVKTALRCTTVTNGAIVIHTQRLKSNPGVICSPLIQESLSVTLRQLWKLKSCTSREWILAGRLPENWGSPAIPLNVICRQNLDTKIYAATCCCFAR